LTLEESLVEYTRLPSLARPGFFCVLSIFIELLFEELFWE